MLYREGVRFTDPGYSIRCALRRSPANRALLCTLPPLQILVNISVFLIESGYFNTNYLLTESEVVRWLRCLHCCLTARRSWVRSPHGALLALGGRSSTDLQCSGGLSPGPFCVEFACSPCVHK